MTAHGMALVDTIKQRAAGVLGFHTDNEGGKPLGVVAAKARKKLRLDRGVCHAASGLTGCAAWSILKRGNCGGQDGVAIAAERRIDSLGVDAAFSRLGLLALGNDLAIPSFRVHRAGGSEVENRDVPRDLQRQHRLTQQIADHVMAGVSAHGSAVLT